MLEPNATSAIRAGELVLAFGSRWDSGTGTSVGAGFTAYDRNGERLFHRFDDEPVDAVEASGPFAYLTLADGDLYVCRQVTVDLRSGTILRELDTYPACNRPSLLVRSNE